MTSSSAEGVSPVTLEGTQLDRVTTGRVGGGGGRGGGERREERELKKGMDIPLYNAV